MYANQERVQKSSAEIPNPEEQGRIITELVKQNGEMKEGQRWCLVASKWLESWIDHTGSKAFWQYRQDDGALPRSSPGPIDNSPLITAESEETKDLRLNEKEKIVQIQMGAQEVRDFFIVANPVWFKLHSWYGGGPLIERGTKLSGVIQKRVKIDLHPVFIVWTPCREDGSPDIEASFSRAYPREATMKEVAEDIERISIRGKNCESDTGLAKMEEETTSSTPAKETMPLASPPPNPPRQEKAKNIKGDKPIVRLWFREEKKIEFPYEIGERVEACYKGEWYPGDLLQLQDADEHGRFTVLCDEDKEKPSKPSTMVKLIRRMKLKENEGDIVIHWRPVGELYADMQLGDPGLKFVRSRICQLMYERRRTDGSWIRKLKVRDWKDFEAGDQLDCLDTEHNWLAATVSEVKEGKIYIHFNGYSSRWDEWVSTDSDRLAKPGTKCKERGRVDDDDGWSSGLGRNGNGYRGSVGLRNLGNTCFMNSTLQCMNATPSLVDFFVDGDFTAEINPDAYKSHGRIAQEFGNLVKEMWSERPHVVVPRRFKEAIGSYAPRFQGYAQQDSQELLACLLEGLHEDLNRVRKKPYDPNPVIGNGTDDEKKGRDSWNKYRKREDSVIIDNIYGQIRSQVICPECGKYSVKFDPCGILQLPFPNNNSKLQVVTLVRADRKVPACMYSVSVPKNGSVMDLTEALASTAGVDARQLVVCEIYQSKVYKVFSGRHDLSSIMANDKIFAFECPELACKDGKQRAQLVPVKHVTSHGQEFGMSFIVALPVDSDGKVKIADVQKIVTRAAGAHIAEGATQAPFKVLIKKTYYDSLAEPDMEDIEIGRETEAGLLWPDRELYKSRTIVEDKSLREMDGDTSERVTLDGCLQAFTKEEVLSAENEYRCSHCKVMARGKKKLDLWRLPKILIIQLKRFQYTRAYRDKIDTYVDYPLENLDLSRWTLCKDQKKNAAYDLYAVSCHGGGLGGGHYWAYAKNLLDKNWYNLNDSSVGKMSVDRVKTRDAYLLFYVRRDPVRKN